MASREGVAGALVASVVEGGVLYFFRVYLWCVCRVGFVDLVGNVMGMKSQVPAAKHEALYQELLAVLKNHRHEAVTPVELLALMSNLVGKILAMQDQRIMTVPMALDIVMKNIEIGNGEAQAGLMDSKGSA